MLIVHLLREGEGPSRVVSTFSRQMTMNELFAKVRPSQLAFVGTEPPIITRHDEDDEEYSIKIREAKAVFVCVLEDPRGTFAPGCYFLTGVTPAEAKTW
jgi:hypothetical protein